LGNIRFTSDGATLHNIRWHHNSTSSASEVDTQSEDDHEKNGNCLARAQQQVRGALTALAAETLGEEKFKERGKA
jgi:hypothetical protein